jgi:hypothetical protein
MGEAGTIHARFPKEVGCRRVSPMSRQGFFIFQAETIEAMRRAFEEVCGALQLTKGGAPRALAAERIFQLAKGGERDAARLASRVIEQFPRQ